MFNRVVQNAGDSGVFRGCSGGVPEVFLCIPMVFGRFSEVFQTCVLILLNQGSLALPEGQEHQLSK